MKQRTRPQVDLLLGDNTIPQVDSVRDLGVIVHSHLKFDIRINHIITRANRLANLIHKCFTSRDSFTLMRAFVTYVRPLLEYASCVWSPHSVSQIKTSSSAIAERPRDALSQLKSCQLLHNCTKNHI